MKKPDIREDSVEKLLLNLKTSKSPGPDGIHPRVLKEVATELAVPLTKIFKSTVESGHLPHLWKTANITPIFKKGILRIIGQSV